MPLKWKVSSPILRCPALSQAFSRLCLLSLGDPRAGGWEKGQTALQAPRNRVQLGSAHTSE